MSPAGRCLSASLSVCKTITKQVCSIHADMRQASCVKSVNLLDLPSPMYCRNCGAAIVEKKHKPTVCSRGTSWSFNVYLLKDYTVIIY